MNRLDIHQYIDQHIDKHIAHIQSWVRQPSVSWDNLGVAECAELVAESYSKLGCEEVEILRGQYHPGRHQADELVCPKAFSRRPG